MAKQHIIECRICGEKFDISNLQENVDWVMPSKNYYYHKSCYDEWKGKSPAVSAKATDKEWYAYLESYLAKDLKMSINYAKFVSQWNNFQKKKMTPKGIFFAIKYYYDVLKGDKEKAEGGIGIVASIYSDSCKYWIEQEKKQEGIVANIERQLKERNEQEKVVLRVEPKKKKKRFNYNIEDI